VFEQSFAPVARRLGWRPEFRWQRVARWAERHGGVRLLERRPMPPLGHFSLIRFERLPSGGDGRGGGGRIAGNMGDICSAGALITRSPVLADFDDDAEQVARRFPICGIWWSRPAPRSSGSCACT